MRNQICLTLLCSIILFLPCTALSQTAFPKILILNSYHKGYSWTDQTVSSIESTILLDFPSADIRVEYMDTKRNSSPEFMSLLSTFYREKFSNQHFDLIFACDDHAIEFLQSFGPALFGTTPVVFSGANVQDTKFLQNESSLKQMTGVLEFADLVGTITLARRLQPNLRNIVVINDNTITGQYVEAQLRVILPGLPDGLNIIHLGNSPIEDIELRLSQLGNDSMVLLLSYFIDNSGRYYDPAFTASRLSDLSTAPIYAVWDFYFNHGILGGVMTSGYLQGQKAAELAKDILTGSNIKEMEIVTDGANEVLVDYRQLSRFDLSMEDLPPEAIVKNISYSDTREVLLVHSYSADNPWTSHVAAGIRQAFDASGISINTYTEFMDTKRHTDKPYVNSLASQLKHKYRQKKIDLVISSDDNAFNLLRKQRRFLFKDTPPIVFCGVNYLPEPQSVLKDQITGVIESYDMLGTIQLGLHLFPETRTLYIVNDQTTTGQANRKRLEEIRAQLPDDLRLHFSGRKSMQQVRDEVAGLDENSLVLLMSFTMDKDNYRFSFVDSAKLITSSSSRPVLGFWDFYLDNGIIGGVVTKGFDQGETAGHLAVSILGGTPINKLPVIEQNPVTPVIDYTVASRFNVDFGKLPEEVKILNRPSSFYEQYKSYVHATLLAIACLLLIVLIQAVRIIRQHRSHKKLTSKAETDPLTGTKNREYFTTSLKALLRNAQRNSEHLTLCYFDLDRLKSINDSFGHQAGDTYITRAVEAIRRHIRANDLLCRVGGDEFIAVLPNCTLEKGLLISRQAEDNFLQDLNDHFPEWPAGISYGCSEFNPSAPVNMKELVEEADKQMYRDKQQKRNTFTRHTS